MGTICTVDQTLLDLEEMEIPDLPLWNRWVLYVLKNYPQLLIENRQKMLQSEYLCINLHDPLEYQRKFIGEDCVGYDILMLVTYMGLTSRYLFLNVYGRNMIITNPRSHYYQGKVTPSSTHVVFFTNQQVVKPFPESNLLLITEEKLEPILKEPCKAWMPRKTISTKWVYL